MPSCYLVGCTSSGDLGAENDNTFGHISKKPFEAPAEIFINNEIMNFGMNYEEPNSPNNLLPGKEWISLQNSELE